MNRKAIIELNSNKISLIILDVKDDLYYNVVDVFSDNISLGNEIKNDGIVKPVLIKELLKVLKMYRRICDNNGITEIYTFATRFLAFAKNNKSILEEIYNTCGFSFSILSTEEEMKYVFNGAINSSDVPKGIFFYIGDEESYLIQFNRKNILNSLVLNFGQETVASIFEDETLSDTDKKAKFEGLFKNEIARADFLKDLDAESQFLSAGNLFLTIGKLARKATRYPLNLENNYVLEIETFKNVYNLIEGMGLDKTKKLKGISSESADKIVAGARIAKMFMETLNISAISISGEGLREGYICNVVAPKILEKPLSDMFVYSLENINTFFATPSSNSAQVYELSINVFKQLKVIHKLPRMYVKALRIAGYMYDCGKRINFNNSTNNSFEVILNSNIKGASHKDLLLAAFACKFQDLDNFNLSDWVRYSAILNEEDLDAAKKIGVIIQLSSALDASKTGVVEDTACDILGDSIIMKTIVTKDADFEIKEAMKVNTNFKKVFTKFIEVI